MTGRKLETAIERYFEDFEVDDFVETAGLTVTEAMMIDYALTYDPQPIHIDKVAAKESLFGELIGSGMQTLAFCLRLFLETGVFRVCSQGGAGMNVRWTKPVYPGDTISVKSTVMAKRVSESRPSIGYMTICHETMNQQGDLVMRIESDHIIKKRPAS